MKEKKWRQKVGDAIRTEAILWRKDIPRSIRSRSGKGLAWIVDMRQIFMRPEVLDAVAELFWEEYGAKLPLQVGGLATGAIPFVTAIVMKGHQKGHEVNGFVIRKERKDTGLCNQIEGDLTEHPVVLVDDLLNSGASVERARLALEQAGCSLNYAYFLIDFDVPEAHENLEHYGIQATSLFTASDFDLPATSRSKASPPSWEAPTMEFAWMFVPENPNYTFGIPNSNPVCDHKRVYFGGSDNYFYALDQESGEIDWRCRVGKTPKSILSSPVLHKGILYFGAYDGNVYAVKSDSGQLVWRHSESDFIGSSPSLAPDLGLVFIGAEYAMPGNRGALIALSMESGETIWWLPLREFLHGSPLYLADRQQVAVGTNDGTVVLVDAREGEIIWTFDAGGEVKHGLAYDAGRNLICFGSFDGHIYGVDATSGVERFRIKTENIVYATPLLVDDKLFCPSTDRSLYVVHLDTHEVLRKIPSYGKLYSSPALLDGVVFWGGNDGIFRGIDPETLQKRHWIRVPERLLSKATHANGRFFINGAGSTLLALQVSEAG